MREIKFRAWHKTKQMMAFVSTLFHDGSLAVSYQKGPEKPGYFFGGNWSGDSWEAKEIELMQFTGLRDKNGVEIYEGDIVKVGDGNMVIVWDTDHLCMAAIWIKCHPEFTSTSALGWTFKKVTKNFLCSIIGNIYANPELP